MEGKTVVVKLTHALVVDGVIRRAGTQMELAESEAKPLLARGVAELVADAPEDADANADHAAAADAAAKAPAKARAK